jgi:hypothetical protein
MRGCLLLTVNVGLAHLSFQRSAEAAVISFVRNLAHLTLEGKAITGEDGLPSAGVGPNRVTLKIVRVNR